MEFRTKLEMQIIQHEVQLHLQGLRDLGFNVPTLQKPRISTANSMRELSQAGFAENPHEPLERPKAK